ncbi:hypothetical protein [Chryseobacterium sp. MP_3.2]|uniref:hypothetical protein n=1 Tax=Chryseobacterium sp. MP_3.2 TaxID=3071712 RepID=UPI002E08326C|nr:hypothetical protein [Chryseobacterium sp. MP_3.2]
MGNLTKWFGEANLERFIKVFNIDFLHSGDKTSSKQTLVISTHGFIKKRSKVPDNEVQKATNARIKYFADQQLKNKKK